MCTLVLTLGYACILAILTCLDPSEQFAVYWTCMQYYSVHLRWCWCWCWCWWCCTVPSCDYIWQTYLCFLTCMFSYAHVRTLSMQVNGVNLLRIHSTGPYAYALTLLDTLFTREEQHPCLLFKSSKSEKPGLDPVRVEILLCKLLLYYYCPSASLQ